MKVIYSDLDGTLLDHDTYSFEPAREALLRINRLGVPLVLCSSKTKGEIEKIRIRLKNNDPFVAENGGGIYFPLGYRGYNINFASEDGCYGVMEPGARINRLRSAFSSVRDDLGLHIRSMGDMSVAEVMELTSLQRSDAEMAMNRRFTEPFIIPSDDSGREKEIISGFEKRGYSVLKGGRFYHLMGAAGKGDAVRQISAIFASHTGAPIVSMALGDSRNDLSMLMASDRPVLIRRRDGTWIDAPGTEEFDRTEGIGPAGWNRAVLDFLEGDELKLSREVRDV